MTGFFRDHDAWLHLQREILPELLADLKPGEPVRVWCAGCASGEEAYGLAILLAEALGVDEFRERVKIYGTDVDEDALATPARPPTPRPTSSRSRPSGASSTSSAPPSASSSGPTSAAR